MQNIVASERTGSADVQRSRKSSNKNHFTSPIDISGGNGERRTKIDESLTDNGSFIDTNSNANSRRRKVKKDKPISNKTKEENAERKGPVKSSREVNDLLEGIDDPSEIDPQDIDLILKLRNRKQRPMADPLTDIGVDPLGSLKNRGDSAELSLSPAIEVCLPKKAISERRAAGRTFELGSYKYLERNVGSFGESRAKTGTSNRQIYVPGSHTQSLLRRNSSTSKCQQGSGLVSGSIASARKEGCSRSGRYSMERRVKGQLQNKMTELREEITRLNDEYNAAMVEQSNTAAYEKKVKELASELTEMQDFLAELNTAADNSMFYSSDYTKGGCQVEELRNRNDRLAENMELIFLERLQKEEQIAELEQQLEEEKRKREALLSKIEPAINIRYKTYLKDIESIQSEIEVLKVERESLENFIRGNRNKSQLLALEREYRGLKRRENLHQFTSSKQNEPEEMTGGIERDKAQTACLEKKLCEISEEIKKAQLLIAMKKDSDEQYGQTHSELKFEEESIENCLSHIDSNKHSLNATIARTENEITDTLDIYKKKLKLQSRKCYFNLHEGNDFFQNLCNTAKSEQDTYERLRECFAQLETKEAKVSRELARLDLKTTNLCEELQEFNSCEKLNENMKGKQNQLLDLKSKAEEAGEIVQKAFEISRNRYNELSKEITENRQVRQISLLEQKLSLLAEKQFFMSENIEEVKTKLNVEAFKKNTLEVLNDINTFLVNNVNII